MVVLIHFFDYQWVWTSFQTAIGSLQSSFSDTYLHSFLTFLLGYWSYSDKFIDSPEGKCHKNHTVAVFIVHSANCASVVAGEACRARPLRAPALFPFFSNVALPPPGQQVRGHAFEEGMGNKYYIHATWLPIPSNAIPIKSKKYVYLCYFPMKNLRFSDGWGMSPR